MTNDAIEVLRQCRPNTRITVTNGGQRFGVVVDAARIVRDFDALTEERDHWRAEAEKWQALAGRLADAI